MKRDSSIHVHPGSILKEDIFAPAHLSLGDAAQLLQVSRLTLSKIVNQKGAITPNIASGFQRLLAEKLISGSGCNEVMTLERLSRNLKATRYRSKI